MSTYLVTGGAGFIGSHIVDALVSGSNTVRVIDDLSSGKLANIEHNLNKIDFINGSVTDIETVEQAVKDVDYIIHLAALVSVPGSIDNPVLANRINIDGMLNVLASAKDTGVKRLVFASSSAVYGNDPTLPKTECSPMDLLSPYALTKLTGEHYCSVFSRLYGLEAVALRYFNVFGPRQAPDSLYAAVIPKFIDVMVKGKQPIIYGDGLQSRDFCYVENIVAANLLACHHPEASGKVFNISCGESLSLLDLVSVINGLLGTSIQPIFEAERQGDVKHSCADVSRAREVLGFEPHVKFEDGMRKLVASVLDDR